MKPLARITRNSFKLKRLFIALLAISSAYLSSCQKSIYEPAIKDPRVAAAKQFFETKVESSNRLTQSVVDSIPSLKRMQSAKMPDWEQAKVQILSTGVEGIKIPIKYKASIKTELGKYQEQVSIDSLSYLFIYKDKVQQSRAELVIRIPDNAYWDNLKQTKTNFSGMVIVEDWNGGSITTFKVDKDAAVTYLKRKDTPTTSNSIQKTNSYYYSLLCYDVPKWITTVTDLSDGSSTTTIEYETYCQYVTVNQDNGGSGGLSTGDYTSGYTGSGGSTGTNTVELQKQAFLNSIITTQAKPCIQNVVSTLKTLSAGKIPNIIQTFAQSPVEFGWNWVISSSSTLPNNSAAATPWPISSNTVVTLINEQYSNSATQLSLARTIIHESVHAFLSYYYKYDTSCSNLSYGQLYNKFRQQYNNSTDMNAAQHYVQSLDFVNSISNSLQEYAIKKGINISDPNYFKDMAWAGLMETTAFTQLPQADKERISSRLEVEATNSAKYGISPLGGNTLCNPPIAVE